MKQGGVLSAGEEGREKGEGRREVGGSGRWVTSGRIQWR